VVICLERGADLHMAQLMPLPLTVSCFSKIQIGFTFLVPAQLGSVCVCIQTTNKTTLLSQFFRGGTEFPEFSTFREIPACSIFPGLWPLNHKILSRLPFYDFSCRQQASYT